MPTTQSDVNDRKDTENYEKLKQKKINEQI